MSKLTGLSLTNSEELLAVYLLANRTDIVLALHERAERLKADVETCKALPSAYRDDAIKQYQSWAAQADQLASHIETLADRIDKMQQ